jgi:hypothetical protein
MVEEVEDFGMGLKRNIDGDVDVKQSSGTGKKWQDRWDRWMDRFVAAILRLPGCPAAP